MALTLQAVLQVQLVYAIFADVGVVQPQMQWQRLLQAVLQAKLVYDIFADVGVQQPQMQWQ